MNPAPDPRRRPGSRPLSPLAHYSDAAPRPISGQTPPAAKPRVSYARRPLAQWLAELEEHLPAAYCRAYAAPTWKASGMTAPR